MTPLRFEEITSRYSSLTVAVLGDFCLDRYLEIDPDRQEISIETGLPVHNVSAVRSLPGGAGTIVSNLSALGIGTIYPIGFAGDDGEGYELCRGLEQRAGVVMGTFVRTAQRRTFTYCKPIVRRSNGVLQELNRFDSKNWTPTPALVEGLIMGKLTEIAKEADAIIVLDQVDVPDTGVVTRAILDMVNRMARSNSYLPIIADSRRSLRDFPPVIFKMNTAELKNLMGAK